MSVLMVSEGVDVPGLRVGVRHELAHGAVLLPGDRALHPRCRSPSSRWRTLPPSDSRWNGSVIAIEEERKHALVFESVSGEDTERGEGPWPKEPFRALWSSASRTKRRCRRRDRRVAELFAEPKPEISPALAAFTPWCRAPPEPETSLSGASACARSHNLVALIARRDKEPHSKVDRGSTVRSA